ncbi:hypothetical protein [Kitasatospora sp. NPDC057223]|uniref:hypothetical protein n=1 Tax=Kitasatospora sp. NPDC057223 TaxID=3346055 RepID=UPI003627B854
MSMVSSAATQVGGSRRSRRLAVALPMAAIAAVGVMGAIPMTSGASTGRPVAAPVSEPASPSPAVTPAEAVETVAPQPVVPPAAPAAAPAVAPSTAAPAPAAQVVTPAPAKPAAAGRPSAAASAQPAAAAEEPSVPSAPQSPAAVQLQPGEGVGVEIRVPTNGGPVQPGGGAVEFTVTWTSTASVAVPVSPVVHVLPFDRPANWTGFSPVAKGDLIRKDETGWVAVDMAGAGAALQGGEFELAPGAARTVRYRLELSGENGPGALPIVAQAFLAGGGAAPAKIGESRLALDVTVPHAPTVVVPVRPTDLTIGHVPSTLRVDLTNPGGDVLSDVAPYLAMIDPFAPGRTVHVLTPGDVTVEVSENGAWRTLPTAYDQKGLVKVDTSSLHRDLAAGEKASFEFRIGIRQYWSEGNGIEFTVGASTEGRESGFQTVRPQTWYPMADMKPANI